MNPPQIRICCAQWSLGHAREGCRVKMPNLRIVPNFSRQSQTGGNVHARSEFKWGLTSCGISGDRKLLEAEPPLRGPDASATELARVLPSKFGQPEQVTVRQ